MIFTIHLNGAELGKYQEYLDKMAADNTEHSEIYKALADQMREQVSKRFFHTEYDGVTRVTAQVGDFGEFDLDFETDTKTTLALMDLMIEHRSAFNGITEFIMAGVKMASGLKTLFKEMMSVVEARRKEYQAQTIDAAKTGTND